MTFDDIVLAMVGVGCALYLARKVKSAMRGEPGCSGGCSGCSSGKSACSGVQPACQDTKNKA